MSSGSMWKEQRKTTINILRKLGMGSNIMAEKIQEEITHYINEINGHAGAAFDPFRLTQSSVSNNICSIVFGKRFDYDDPTFQEYLNISEFNSKHFTKGQFLCQSVLKA